MITAEARREITELPRGGSHAMLVEWVEPPRVAPAPGASKRERLDRLLSSLRALKEPLLSRLSRIAGVEVEDLPSQPQVIVRASGERWRQLAATDGPLAQSPEVRLLPTTRFYAQVSSG